MKAKYILLSLAILLAACAKDDTAEQSSQRGVLHIQASIASTRAPLDRTNFVQGDEIGVNVEYNEYNNIYGNFNGQQWELGTTVRFSDEDKKAIYAYYPYSKEFNELKWGTGSGGVVQEPVAPFIPINITPTESNGQQEYLYATPAYVTADNPSANLQFNFALARLTFRLKLDAAQGDKSSYVTSARLSNNSYPGCIHALGYMSVADGTIVSYDNGFYAFTLPVNQSVTANDEVQVDFLVIPTTISSDNTVYLELTIDGKNYQIDIPASEWKKGRQYTYPITIDLSEEPTPEPFETKTFTVDGVSFTMVAVEGGTFQMGSDDSDAYSDEKPVHSVTLSDYYIGETEVTQALWKAVMGSNPSYFVGDNLPVERVNWDDCQEFIEKLNQKTGANFRLPTEAQWEFAARGGTKSKGYKYSGSDNVGEVAWYNDISDKTTHNIKTKQANELGIYDMSGNVWEWCQDWYDSYSSDAQTNPTGPSSGSNRVYRGGSWYFFARFCRSSGRNSITPSGRGYYLGLRLVL